MNTMPILEKTEKEYFNTTVPVGFRKKLQIVKKLMKKENPRLRGITISNGDAVSWLCDDYIESRQKA